MHRDGINRRSFLVGASVGVGVGAFAGFVIPNYLDQVPELTVPPPPPLRPASNRTFVVNERSADHKVFHAWNNLIIYPEADYLEFWYPNWLATGGGRVLGGRIEVGAGGYLTAVAQLTYTDRETNSSVTVPLLDLATGGRELFATDGDNLKAYAAGLKIAPGAKVVVEFLGQRTSGMIYAQRRADLQNGDALRYGASDAGSLGDQPGNTYADGRFWYGPCLVLGKHDGAALAIVGDSNSTAISDIPDDEFGSSGPLARAASRLLPTVNVSVPGETAADYAVVAQSAKRRELTSYATNAAISLGTNDVIFQGRNAEQAYADIMAIVESFAGPVILATVPPATVGDLSTPVRGDLAETRRIDLNTLIRAGENPVFDQADALETGRNSGEWASADYVDAEPTGDTTHFVHLLSAGSVQAATAFESTWLSSEVAATR